MIAFDQRHQPRRIERPVNQIQIVLCQPQRAEKRPPDSLRAIVVDLQPHRVPFAPVVQLVLYRLEQIPAVLLVQVKFAVPRQPKVPVAEYLRPRKQIGQKMPDDLPEKNIILLPPFPRQSHHRRQHPRGLHDGEVPEVFPARFHLQLHHDVERFVEQLRKGMHRINRQRRQDRPDFAAVKILQPFQVRRAEPGRLEETDAVPFEFRRQLFAPADVLIPHHAPDAFLHGAQRFGGRQSVDAPADRAAFDLLFEAGHAHLEELVQVGAGDAKKLEPFQQRIAGIARLLQHPLVELQPAQLAIEVARRLRRCLGRLHGGSRP